MSTIELRGLLDLGLAFLPPSDVVTRPAGRLIPPAAPQVNPTPAGGKLGWAIGGAVLGGLAVALGLLIATAIEEG